MHKKILRIFSLVLVLSLLLCALPMSAQADAVDTNTTKEERICEQIRTLYRQTLQGAGKSSLHGYCGTMVNWHLYLMGIATKVHGNDGNTQYDFYCNQEYTDGGFRVRTYSASDYNTLEAALNAVSHNGTRDVYNLVVCFDRTNTTAGRRYGHALVVHAIIDGMVYFSESFSGTFAGKYYPEGSPVIISIADFARYYAPWTVFEGVLHFGLKTYAEDCQYYPSFLYASVMEQTQMYTSPCTAETDARSSLIRDVQPGERLVVVGLYRNTMDEYWYQVEGNAVGYVPAESTQVMAMRYDDITATGVSAPTMLRTGRSFDLKGKIRSSYNRITSVRTQVFSYDQESKSHVMSASTVVSGSSFSLAGSKLSNDLSFRLLEEGSYRYELAAVIGNNYYADGCLQTEWKTVKLWTSDFQVAQSTTDNCTITFDAAGGNTSLNAMNVTVGDVLPQLPEATREGYVFEGWYTEDGVLVEEGYEVDGNIDLVAQWTNATDIDGWHVEDGNWYYYIDGLVQTGFVEIDGVIYHLNVEGYVDTGLMRIMGQTYYFHANGAMHTGWLDLDGEIYYMTEDGSAAVGNVIIDGVSYFFDKLGVYRADPPQG